MNRLEYIFNALAAEYAGAPDTTWYLGAEHVHRHDNWNRVVVYPSEGAITLPGMAAQGWALENLNTQAAEGARDDIHWERRPRVHVGIWASSYTQAENRLHAMLVALAVIVGTSNLEAAELSEQWLRSDTLDVSGGGSLVVLSFTPTFYVLTSDAAIVANAALNPEDPEIPVGEGGETSPVDGITIAYEQDGEPVATEVTIVPEET